MKKYLLILLLLFIPTFALMLRPGIYTMHDFHVFRLFEFDKCLTAGTLPCHWAPDAGKGYGEPLFNFYGQFPYWIGEVIHLLGFSILDSSKLLFILTLVLSGVSMFYLSRKFWGSLGAVLSSVLYVYAPYRAVDVWVRGALNESLAFVLFPFIWYHFDELILNRKPKHLLYLSLGFAALITTHNLSVLMIAPFMFLWWMYRRFKGFPVLISAGIIALLLSAYYLIPVALENKYITISQTTMGYYDFRAHFVTLKQLFISNFWGYGGSTWGPNDTMSFSVSYLLWIVPIVITLFLLIKRRLNTQFFVFLALGVFAVFLTHNKSAFIWTHLPPMAYIQFPWRFLTLSTFFLALACGAASLVLPKKILLLLPVAAILINFSFFRPDIWRPITDAEQFSGQLWDEERSSALQDFWPKYGSQPTSFAPATPAEVLRTTEYVKIRYPIVYFPGWIAKVDGHATPVFPDGNLGLITLRAPLNYSQISLKFVNTWPRTLGNCLSVITLLSLSLWYFSKNRYQS